MALFLGGDPPRMVRGMGEYYLPTIPFFSVFMHRVGSVVGTPSNCAHLLGQEEAIMVFPEGERGFVKTYRQRYQLQRFGLGFMRLALETDTPIVPVGMIFRGGRVRREEGRAGEDPDPRVDRRRAPRAPQLVLLTQARRREPAARTQARGGCAAPRGAHLKQRAISSDELPVIQRRRAAWRVPPARMPVRREARGGS